MKDYSVFVKDLNKSYTFCLKVDSGLEHKIQIFAHKIIAQQTRAGFDLSNSVVTLTSDKNVITYKTGQQESILDENQEPLPNAVVKVMHLAQLRLPQKVKTVKEIIQDLFRKWSVEKPAAKFFAGLIIYPLSLLIRIFCPKRDDYQTFFNQMTEQDQPDSLLADLKWSLDIFNFPEKENLSQEFHLSFQLKEAIQQAEHLKKTKDVDVAQPIAEQIMARWEQAKRQEGQINLSLIASGYWCDNHFYPSLFSFYKDNQGRFCLSAFQKHGFGEIPLDYSFPEDLTAIQLSKVLKTFFILSFKPPQKRQEDIYKDLLGGLYGPLQEGLLRNHLYDKEQNLEDLLEKVEQDLQEFDSDDAPKDLMSFPNLNLQDFYQQLWASVGAVSFTREGRKTHLLNDPWKILQETLQMQFSEIPPNEKFLFVLGLFHVKAEALVRNFAYFSDLEKKQWTDRLKTEFKSLERASRKVYGDDAVLREFIQGNIFEKTRTLIAQLHDSMEDQAERQPETILKRLISLDQIPKQSFVVQAPLQHSHEKNNLTLGLSPQILQQIEHIHDLITTIESDTDIIQNTQRLHEELSAFSVRMDELVENKKFQEVLSLYHLLHEILPVPNYYSTDNCWNILRNNLNEGTFFDLLSRDLAKIAHYFWESKLRLREELTPQEAVDLLNMQAILEFFLLARQEIALNQLKNVVPGHLVNKLLEVAQPVSQETGWYRFFGAPSTWSTYKDLKDQINWAEVRAEIKIEDLSLLFCNFHDYRMFRKVVHQRLLRTSISPQLNHKLQELEWFIVETPLNANSNEFRYQTLKLFEFPKLLGIWHLYHGLPIATKQKKYSIAVHPSIEKSWQVLAPTVFSLEEIDQKKPHLPPLYSDVLRHYVQMQNLWDKYNITSYQSRNPLKQIAQEAKNWVEDRINSLTLEDRYPTGEEKLSSNEAKNHDLYLQLNQYDRLKLAAMPYTPIKLPLLNDHYEISPILVGAKKQNQPIIEITEKMSYDYFYCASIGMDPFYKKMGKPHSDIDLRLESNDEEKHLLKYLQKSQSPINQWLFSCLEITLPRFMNWNHILAQDEEYASRPNSITKDNYIALTNSFSPYNIIEVFDLILQRPDYLGERTCDNHIKFFLVLFRFNVVRSLVYKYLEYFSLRSQELKSLIHRLLEKQNTWQAFFLLFLCSLLRHHFRYTYERINKSPLSDKLEKLISDWPSFSSDLEQKTNYYKKAFDQLNSNHLSFGEQMDLSAYLLLDFAMDPDYQDKGNLLHLPVKTLAQLIFLTKKIENGLNAISMPMLGKMALDWSTEHLLPLLPKLKEKTPSFLEEYFLLHTDISTENTWKKEENSGLWKKDRSIIDLATMNFLKLHGKTPKGVSATLPQIVASSKEFIDLFGHCNVNVLVKATADPNILIYSLENLPYRIHFELSSQKFYIEQKINFGGQRQWYRLSKTLPPKPKAKKQKMIERLLPSDLKKAVDNFKEETKEPGIHLKGIEFYLEQKGYWQDLLNPHRGLFVYSQLEAPSEDKIFVLFFHQGFLEKVQTPSGKWLVPSNQDYEDVICPLQKNKVFFARSLKEHYISEINLPSAGITLTRQDKTDLWTFQDGMIWRAGGLSTPLFSQVRVFGKHFEQFGLIAENTSSKEYRLLLWPHRLEQLDGQLHIDKGETGDACLIIRYDDEGTIIKGSVEAFLYMAYLYTFFKDYQKASYYLKQCHRAGLSKSGEFQLLKQLSSLFKLMPGQSLRNVVLRLKAELLIRKIAREFIQKFDPSPWQELVEDAQNVASLFSIYLQQKKRSLSGDERFTEEALAKEVDLEAVELEELRLIQKESLLAYMTAAEPKQAFWVEKIDFEEFKNQFHAVLVRMKKPAKHFDLAMMHPLRVQNVVDHFFELWNFIIDKHLETSDLLFLFAPAEKSLKDIVNQEKMTLHDTLMYTLNLCRKVLLALASLPKERRTDLKYNIQKVYALHKQIPSTVWGLGFSAAWGKLKMNHFTIDEFNLLVPIKKALNRMPQVVQWGRTNLSDDELKESQKNDLSSEKKFDLTKYSLSLKNSSLNEVLDKGIIQNNLPLEMTVKKLEKETGLNLVLEERKKALESSIQILEQKLTKTAMVDQSTIATPSIDVSEWSKEDYFIAQPDLKGISPAKIEAVLAQLQEQLILTESEKLGLIEAADFLKKEQKYSHLILNPDQLSLLTEKMQDHCRLLKEASSSYRENIYQLLQEKNLNLPKSLRWILVNSAHVPKAELLSQALAEYQKACNPFPETLNTLITRYLIVETEKTQFAEILPKTVLQLAKLLEAKADYSKVDEWMTEWRILSNHLYCQMRAASHRVRYPVLNQFTRKYLVAEYRTSVIMRPQVCQLIEKIVESPSAWYELRPGLGKTSFVLPLVLSLLSEKGYFSVGLIKDELIEQNYEALDPRTKLLSEQSAVRFSFELNDPHTSLTLLEIYYRLLKAKEANSYLMTTIHHLANIEHTLNSYKQKIHELLSHVFSKNNQEAQQTIIEYQQRFYWLCKIRNLFKSLNDSVKFETILFGDEIDEILHILYENNLGMSTENQLDGTICEVMEVLIHEIYTSQEALVVKFKEALTKGTHAALVEEFDQTAHLLVRSLKTSPALYKLLGCFPGTKNQGLLDAMPVDTFVEAICKTWSKDPSLPNPFKNFEQTIPFKKGIYALSRLLKTMKVAIAQDFYIDYGLKKDGYTVGPKTSGVEKAGMFYGNEFDIICNQYLLFASGLELDEGFFKKALSKFQEVEPLNYQSMEENARKNGYAKLLYYLAQPVAWKDRIHVLKSQVIQDSLILSNKKQSKLTLQSLVQNSRVGGMTGTLNSYLLPQTEGFYNHSSVQGVVTGETYLRIGVTSPPGVRVIKNESTSLSYFQECAKDFECKAIINEGQVLSKKTEALIGELRNKLPNRTYVYIHSLERVSYIWFAEEIKNQPKEPMRISKTDLEMLLTDAEVRKSILFYFAPADARGTDFVIPYGYGAVFTGLTTTVEKFTQSVWRQRGLGEQHQIRFYIPQAIAEKIPAFNQNETLSWIDLVNYIQNYTSKNLKSIHLKAQLEKIRTLLITGARDLLTQEPTALDVSQVFQKEEILQNAISNILAEDFLFTTLNPLMIYDNETVFEDLQINYLQDISLYVQEFYENEKKKVKDYISKICCYPDLAHPKIQKAVLRLNQILKDVKKQEDEFVHYFSFHQEFLPNKVPKVQGTPGAFAHVQQQAQQLQQAQQQEAVQIQVSNERPDLKDLRARGFTDWQEFTERDYSSIGMFNICVTPNSDSIMQLLKQMRCGDPIFKVFVIEDVDGWKVALLTHLDFHLVLDREIKKRKIKGSDTPCAVYSLMNGVYYEDGVLPIKFYDLEPDLESEELNLRLVQVKCLLGYYQYSEKEQKALKKWINRLDTKTFHNLLEYIQKRCTTQLRDFLFSLRFA